MVEMTDVQRRIFLDRYAQPGETEPEQLWRRVARAVSKAEKTTELQQEWEEHFYWLLENWRYVPGGRILAAMGVDANVTAQNCYVIPSPEDSRKGIMHSLAEWVDIQACGGGVGVNISSLRPRGAPVKSVNGTSSGPVTWAQLFAFASKEVIIQGGTRRGAAMIMIDDTHPDVFEFIHAKEKPGVLEGANLSVCLSDSFMDAVKRDEDWELYWGGTTFRIIKARRLWDEICEAAWRSAEPGIYFMERANKEANSGYFETLISTNPCGEQPLGPYGACLLGSLNLAVLSGTSDLGVAAEYAVRFNDNIIDLSHYPTPECRESQQRIRRMGIGVMGLADALIANEMRYGSLAAVGFTQQIFGTIRNRTYRASIKLARERGAFPAYEGVSYIDRPFIQHLPYSIRDDIAAYGIRNCYLLTQAPTGTISLLAGVNSGIEPYFDFDYARNDRTGQYDVTSSWAEQYKSPDRPAYLVTSNDVTPEEHVAMQAAAQRYVDSSISKTVNAPTTHTIEDVKKLYMLAYDSGLKSISYYRDLSRSEQVLYHKTEEEPLHSTVVAVSPRRRMPVEREGVIRKFVVGEQEGYMTVGLYDDGTPGELFVDVSKAGSTVSGLFDIVAMLTSYALQHGVPLAELVDKLKGTRFEPAGLTNDPAIPVATSLVDYVFRYLERRFLNPDASSTTPLQSGVGCPECGAGLLYTDGCLQCRSCGYNRCG